MLDEEGLEALRAMLPLCDVITPNIAEAAILARAQPIPEGSGWDEAPPRLRKMAASLHELGAKAVVITGGHLDPPNDYLSARRAVGIQEEIISAERIESRSTHGTGCAFATALACRLALGDELSKAARAAKDFVRNAIRTAYPLGKGIGPLNHFG